MANVSNGAHLGEGLKSVLRHEARELQGVVRSRRLLVPNRPVMHIAVVLIVGNLFEVGAGRTGRVGHGIGVLRDRAPQDVGEQDHVILPDAVAGFWRDRFFEFLAIAPVLPAGFNFIIAAPDHDAGMIAQALDLIDGFLPHIFLKGNVAGNHVAAEHEFLPDHNAEFIADIVEIVGLVVTAAPLANHVHVRIASGLKNIAMNLGSDTVRKAVERNHVRAFGEDGDAIHHELETLAPLIGNAAQFDRTQSCFRLGMSRSVFTDADRGGKSVTVLSAVTNRIPEFRRRRSEAETKRD